MKEYYHSFEYDLGGIEISISARIEGDEVDLWLIEGPNGLFDPDGYFVEEGHWTNPKLIPLTTRLENLAVEYGEQVVKEG